MPHIQRNFDIASLFLSYIHNLLCFHTRIRVWRYRLSKASVPIMSTKINYASRIEKKKRKCEPNLYKVSQPFDRESRKFKDFELFVR